MSNTDEPYERAAGWHNPLLQGIPVNARRVLVVACDRGRLGTAVRARQPGGCEVLGIEREPAAARRAAAVLHRVFTLDVETDDPPLEPCSVDVIVYAEILERLADPLGVLDRHRPLLAPGGEVIVCVPNVQRHTQLAA